MSTAPRQPLMPRADDRCPRCEAARVVGEFVLQDGTILDACLSCRAIWERETRENPFAERCGNCAFRPGSPEQADPERWRQIVTATVRKRGIFYCHKRVPFDITPTGRTPFQHRQEGDHIVNATECAGWIDAKLARMDREESTHG